MLNFAALKQKRCDMTSLKRNFKKSNGFRFNFQGICQIHVSTTRYCKLNAAVLTHLEGIREKRKEEADSALPPAGRGIKVKLKVAPKARVRTNQVRSKEVKLHKQ